VSAGLALWPTYSVMTATLSSSCQRIPGHYPLTKAVVVSSSAKLLQSFQQFSGLRLSSDLGRFRHGKKASSNVSASPGWHNQNGEDNNGI
jgi:hypothetical protein